MRLKSDKLIILTTHYLDEADRLSDRIGIMVNGKLLITGNPEEIKKKFGVGYSLTFS